MTGPIPSWLVNLTELLELSLWSNQLTGTIPLEVAPAQDLAALLVLYGATGGPNWTDSTNWRSNEPLLEWHGVSTDAEGRVDELRLSANGLTGSVGAELGVLANLTGLYLNNNGLSGPLPLTLSALSQLSALDIRSTTLCAPADAAFQAWLTTINFQGAVCVQLVSNLDQPKYGFGSLEDYDLAQAFTTGANGGGYTLTSVEIALYNATDTTFPGTVSIWNESSVRRPDSSMGTLTNPSLSPMGTCKGVALPRSRLSIHVIVRHRAGCERDLLRGDRCRLQRGLRGQHLAHALGPAGFRRRGVVEHWRRQSLSKPKQQRRLDELHGLQENPHQRPGESDVGGERGLVGHPHHGGGDASGRLRRGT